MRDILIAIILTIIYVIFLTYMGIFIIAASDEDEEENGYVRQGSNLDISPCDNLGCRGELPKHE